MDTVSRRGSAGEYGRHHPRGEARGRCSQRRARCAKNSRPAAGGLLCESRIAAFVGSGSDYYRREFERLGKAPGHMTSFNPAAAVMGPLWLAARRLWGWLWPFLILRHRSPTKWMANGSSSTYGHT
ncbi:MAG: hypothetical protein OXQ29_14165 [Rhodospirillaceae bacterium]|nr:hypothetical protein [Rhodospirillaceae bacterium]